MRAHLTADVKQKVKQMNATLAVIPGGLTKELQPLDIGVNRPFKVRLRAAWERWMTEGDHGFTKSGGQAAAVRVTPRFADGLWTLGLTCLLARWFELSEKPASFPRSPAQKVTLTVTKANLPCWI